MPLLRNAQQVALHDLLVALSESADHYEDAAEFLQTPEISAALRALAGKRRELCKEVETAVRASGDLPAVPDTERENLNMLVEHLQAAVTAQKNHKVLQHRQENEQALQRLIEDALQDPPDATTRGLLERAQTHSAAALRQLQELLQRTDAAAS